MLRFARLAPLGALMLCGVLGSWSAWANSGWLSARQATMLSGGGSANKEGPQLPEKVLESAGGTTQVKDAEVDKFGAVGDGVKDDTAAIQEALNFAFANHVPKLSFTKGKTYLLDSARSQNSLVVYGDDLVIDGNGATIVYAAPNAGYFGAVFDIGGPIHGAVYPITGKYSGATHVARNIVLENIVVRHQADTAQVNSIGIHNVSNVRIFNVNIFNSPQTGIAVVADSKDRPVSNVVLSYCTVSNSGVHAFRIHLDGTAETLTVSMDHCSSKGVRHAETAREVRGEHVQLWYRAAGKGGQVGLNVADCSFDRSGVVLANFGARNLVLKNNEIEGGLVIGHKGKGDIGFSMSGNKIGGGGLRAFSPPLVNSSSN